MACSTLAVKYNRQLPQAVVAAISVSRLRNHWHWRRGSNTRISTISTIQISATLKFCVYGQTGAAKSVGSLSVFSGTGSSSFSTSSPRTLSTGSSTATSPMSAPSGKVGPRFPRFRTSASYTTVPRYDCRSKVDGAEASKGARWSRSNDSSRSNIVWRTFRPTETCEITQFSARMTGGVASRTQRSVSVSV